jgi:hypothetical protein
MDGGQREREVGQGAAAAAAAYGLAAGATVHVAAKRGRGPPKEGGVGRISKVNPDGSVDVKLLIGGGERRVELVRLFAFDIESFESI